MRLSTPTTKRGATILGVVAAGAAGVAVAAGAFGTSSPLSPPEALAAELRPFDSCEEVLDYVDEHEWARAWGGVMPLAGAEGGIAIAVEDAGAATRSVAALPDAGAEAVAPAQSGTNVQEEGIDEPDIAKLAGDTLFVVAKRSLQAFDVGGEEPLALGRIDLAPTGGDLHYGPTPQLLLAGERVLVIDESYRRAAPHTRLTAIDVSDPSAMSVTESAEVEGMQVSARLRGSTAHLVVASSSEFRDSGAADSAPEETPAPGATGATGPTGPDDAPAWLPRITITDAEGAAVTQPLFGCDAVSYPRDFAGLGMLSLLTLDLGEGLEPADVDAVMTNGRTVYASPESIYVATESIAEPSRGVVDTLRGVVEPGTVPEPAPSFPDETTIHRFDTAEEDEAHYAASGAVAGRLLSQWSMSEHEGHLRVAATVGDPWAPGPGESESAVTVLAERDGQLREVGRVGGLGGGETIHAVRFIDDIGYVVTFEQTDPLYTIDLSTPSEPRMTGELKIPGYSAYLHPVGSDQLLGIGQGGTDAGILTGAQASLFDIGDLSSPKRVDTLDLTGGQGSTTTEWDHHAFLYWPEAELAVVPVQEYGAERFAGAVAMRVSPDGALAELARLEDDPAGRRPIERALVVGEHLVTVSQGGVTSRDMESLETTGSAPFADE